MREGVDELVYVFRKSSDVEPGFWEGEVNGLAGVFPPQFVVEVKI